MDKRKPNKNMKKKNKLSRGEADAKYCVEDVLELMANQIEQGPAFVEVVAEGDRFRSNNHGRKPSIPALMRNKKIQAFFKNIVGEAVEALCYSGDNDEA